MKKRIVAAVLALLMVCSSMPMSDIAEFVPDVGISVSAASSVEVKNYNGQATQITYDVKKDKQLGDYLSITVPTGFFENKSEVIVDTTSIKNALTSAGVTVTGYAYVELNYRFDMSKHSLLSSVKFTDSFITKLGNNMFTSHTNLTNADLGKSIKYLGDSVFSNCTNFVGTSNNIMNLSNVVSIGNGTFNSCKSLAGVTLSSSLTSIGDTAFSSCSKLINVTIPKSVKTIGKNAFSSNAALVSVTFENGSLLESMGDNTFSNCTSLSKVNVGTTENTFPTKLTSVGKNLFSGCTSLQKFTLNTALVAVPEYMFLNCTSLKEVVFPSKSECLLIGEGAFQNCSSIIQMTLSDKVAGIGPRAYSGCTKLSKLIVPDDLAAFVPASSNTATFDKCYALSLAPKSKASQLKANQIIIPDKITYIPTLCFSNCTGITDVVMPKVTDIGGGAFSGCTSLPKITVPDAVTTIRESVFEKCSSLTTVVYSKNLKEIEQKAFKDCKALKTATPNGTAVIKDTVQIPKSCGAAQKEAFANCTSIKYINVLGGTSSEFATIGESAFSGCSSLEGSTVDGTSSQELKFPKLVTVIQAKAFEKCTKLKTIQFEGNVTTIGDYVFQNCSSLTKVTVNPTITQIGQSAFLNCSSLTTLPVTKTGASALTQLERIYPSTFQGCTSLKVVDISAANKIESIDQLAFSGCTNMTKLILPAKGAVKSIGNNAFQNCTNLEVVNTTTSATKTEFPKTIVSIGLGAFINTGLKDVTLHKPSDTNAYNTIGDSAFSGCTKLTNVDFSDTNLTTLPKSIFNKDEALTTVKLPTTLVAISESAFADCKALSTINSTTKGTASLPANLKTIGAYAFQNTHCLSKFVIPAATDNIDMSAFNSTLTYTQADLDSGKINPLKEFSVASANPNYKSTNGVLYNKDGSTLLRYPRMKTGTSFTVPSSVTEIAQAGMGSNNYLEKVTIGANVAKISKEAFNKMTGLRSVDFGTNTTVEFEQGAFTGFSGNPKIVFYAAKGSTAEAYALKNSNIITFIDNSMKATSLEIKQGYNLTVSRTSGKFQLEAVLKTASGKVTTDVLTWTCDNTDVVSVDNNGNVTPRANGTAKITVKSASGLTKVVTINVGDEVVRLWGSGRYATAADISEKMYDKKTADTKTDTVILAYGLNSADALAGVPLARKLNAPILLTTKDKLPDETLAEIKRLGATKVKILGGTGAISEKVVQTLKDNGIKDIERIAGGTRYGTATAIAKKVNSAPTEIFFVYGLDYADALSASAVAAAKGAPIIYLKTDGSIDADTAAYLATVKGKVKNAYVIGGKGVISDAMMKKAADALGLTVNKTVTRTAGSNRYETCVEVNKKFASVLPGTAICLATGNDFPDALAGGVFAAKNSAPLFLVNTKLKTFKLTDTQTAYLKDKGAKRFYVFGGTGAVPDNVVSVVKAVK